MGDVRFEVEHHFEKKCLLPEHERVFPDVHIAQYKDKGEALIEKGFGKDKGKIELSFGGISIKLKQTDWTKLLKEFWNRTTK